MYRAEDVVDVGRLTAHLGLDDQSVYRAEVSRRLRMKIAAT